MTHDPYFGHTLYISQLCIKLQLKSKVKIPKTNSLPYLCRALYELRPQQIAGDFVQIWRHLAAPNLDKTTSRSFEKRKGYNGTDEKKWEMA
jgi:hypothetical protein